MKNQNDPVTTPSLSGRNGLVMPDHYTPTSSGRNIPEYITGEEVINSLHEDKDIV
jgi:hypothetical protein